MEPDELARQADEELNTIEVEPEPPEPSPDDDGDDDEDSGVQPTPEQRQTRKEKRGARAGNYRELKEQNERLDRELRATREAQARMEGLMQANMQRPQPQQGPHPLELAVDEVLREQDDFYKSYTAQLPKMTPQEQEEATRRARALEVKKVDAMTRLSMARMGVGQGVAPQQIRQMAFQEQLNMRYSDIAADPKATEIGGHIARRMFAEGKPQTWETLDEAAEETRKLMGWGSAKKAPKPSETTKAKFVGTPAGPRAGGGGGDNKPIRITKKQAQLAENAYPNLPANKAHQKWWNEVGKKYA